MADTSTRTIPFDPHALLREFDPDNNRERFYEHLMAENRRVNLVSRETTREDFEKLYAESLLPFTQLRFLVGTSYLDIGTGGGFPALPLLLSGRIDGHAVLVERREKKAGALRRMLLALGLTADVLARDLSQCRFDEPFDLITLRLVKLDRRLWATVRNLLSERGVCVYFGVPEFAIDDIAVFSWASPPHGAVKQFSLIRR